MNNRYFANSLSEVKALLVKISIKIIDKLPVNNRKIVYDNFNGSGFGGNPKYINEYLQTKNKYKSVWLTKGDHEFPTYVKTVRINSLRAYYEASTAKVRITNIRNSKFPKKKKSQIHIQTWHSSYGFKKCEKAIENQLNPNYVKAAKYDGLITDAIIADSELQKKGFQKNFWLNDEVEYLCYGLPRTDELISCQNKQEVKDGLFAKYGIPKDNLLVLYAPTFRDDKSTNGYLKDFSFVQKALQDTLEQNVTIGVRFHPNAKEEFHKLNYQKVINLTDEGNMQEIEIAADILITDYSSVMFDFAILNKPVFVCATDFDSYSKIRIKVDEYTAMPFPLTYSEEDLIMSIKNFDKQSYQYKVGEFLKKHPFFSDGHSAEKVGNWIINKINTK